MLTTLLLISSITLITFISIHHKKQIQKLRIELNEKKDIAIIDIQEELDAYKEHFLKSYYYNGTYPNWRATQDFEQLIKVLTDSGELKTNASLKIKAHALLDYLNQLTKATSYVIRAIPEDNLCVAPDRYYLSSRALRPHKTTN